MFKKLLSSVLLSAIILSGGVQTLAAETTAADLPKLTEYSDLMKKSAQKEKTVVEYEVSTAAEFEKVLEEVFTDLPNRVKVKTKLSRKELNTIKDEWESKVSTKDFPNVRTLANYSITKMGTLAILDDTSNKNFTAKQIETGLSAFSKLFAAEIKDLSETEKLDVIYDYIYDNIRYEAKGYLTMYVGNAFSGKIACNGYSHLFYALAKASGIDAEIVFGGDHFWNKVTLSNGDVLNVDITTDDLLKKHKYTYGSSPEEHIQKVKETNMYSVAY